MRKTLHSDASVSFEMSVINPDGSIARALPKRRNLLLDKGLNQLALSSWIELFSFFALGTTSNPTSRDSGLITVTIAGGTAMASAGFFEAADVGRLIKCDSGEERYITAYTSPTVVTVAGSDVAASQFTVWYVNDTSLGAEDHRFNTMTADAGDHGYSWNGVTGILSTWKTMISNAVTVGAITFKEIGWSNSGSTADGVNGRALINAGVGDTLVTGQRYKVKLTLDRTFSPATPRACPAIAGWGGTAQEQIEEIMVSYWTPGGGNSTGGVLEPKSGNTFALSTASDALRAPVFYPDAHQPMIGAWIDGTWIDGTLAAYVSNTFYRDQSVVFDAGVSTGPNVRSITTRADYYGPYFVHRMLMDADHAKTSADKLTFTYRKSWGRNLIN